MSPCTMYLLCIQAASGSERERQVAAVHKTPALQLSRLQAHLWFSRNSLSPRSNVGTAVSGSGGGHTGAVDANTYLRIREVCTLSYSEIVGGTGRTSNC